MIRAESCTITIDGVDFDARLAARPTKCLGQPVIWEESDSTLLADLDALRRQGKFYSSTAKDEASDLEKLRRFVNQEPLGLPPPAKAPTYTENPKWEPAFPLPAGAVETDSEKIAEHIEGAVRTGRMTYTPDPDGEPTIYAFSAGVCLCLTAAHLEDALDALEDSLPEPALALANDFLNGVYDEPETARTYYSSNASR